MRDDQLQAKRLSWVDRFRPALDLALDEFLAAAQWPEREPFRRKLTQRGLDDFSLDEMLQDMPRSPWGRNMVVPDRIVLSLQVLQELPKAKTLLDVCMAIVGRAYEQYSSETVDDPVLRSDDPVLLSAAGGDAGLLLRAREVLGQHPPGPLGGGGSGIDSTEWTRMLNDAAMPAFRGIATVGDYLAAQERIIGDDRRVYGRVPAMPRLSPFGRVLTQPTQTSPNARDFRCFRLFGVLWSSCSVSVLVAVFRVVLAVSGHGCCPRVAAGLARGSTVRVPRRAGRFLLPDGLLSWRRLAEAGCEHGDLGFPGNGCLGGAGVREFRACLLRAS